MENGFSIGNSTRLQGRVAKMAQQSPAPRGAGENGDGIGPATLAGEGGTVPLALSGKPVQALGMTMVKRPAERREGGDAVPLAPSTGTAQDTVTAELNEMMAPHIASDLWSVRIGNHKVDYAISGFQRRRPASAKTRNQCTITHSDDAKTRRSHVVAFQKSFDLRQKRAVGEFLHGNIL